MGGGPIQHQGAWWQQRADGTWLRWNEQTNTWEPQPPAPPQAAPQQGWQGPAQPGWQGQTQGQPAGQGQAQPGWQGQTQGQPAGQGQAQPGWQGQAQPGWQGQPAYAQAPVRTEPPAQWWQRALALIIDGFVLGIPGQFLSGAILGNFLDETTADLQDGTLTPAEASNFLDDFLPTMLVLIGVSFLIAGTYNTVMHGWKGQTLGKMALGIKVVDKDGGGVIGYGRAFWRWFVTLLLAIPAGIPLLIDYLSPLWDDRNQAWHDKAANSLVVKTR